MTVLVNWLGFSENDPLPLVIAIVGLGFWALVMCLGAGAFGSK